MIAWIILISSCKKNDEGSFIYAGKFDTSYKHHVFSPTIALQVKWDSLNLYGFGTDSIDLNSDNIFDLVFQLQILNNDSIHLLNGLPDPFPYLYVIHKNNSGVSIYNQGFSSGLGSSGIATYANTFLLDEKIYENSEWSEEEGNGKKLWGDNPTFYYPKGKWYTLNEAAYLGIKLNGKLGWIEIDNTNLYNPKLLSFALQKN